MTAVVVLLVFVAVVALLSRRGAGSRVRLTSCCGARPWPPDDLTGSVPERRADATPVGDA